MKVVTIVFVILFFYNFEMKAQKKYTYNSMVMFSVNNEIYNFKEDSLNYEILVKELLNNLSILNPKKNSVTQYYIDANLNDYGVDFIEDRHEEIVSFLLEEKKALESTGKTVNPKSQLLSYYIQYKYLETFKDVWYYVPHKMLNFSDDYLSFLDTIPFFRDNNFIYDDNVLRDNFNANVIFPLEKLLLGDKSENLDMYLAQLDKKVCLEILKNKCESPDYLKVENEMFFKIITDSVVKNHTVLMAYF